MPKKYLYIFFLVLLSCKTYHTTNIQWDEYHLEEKKKHINADTAAINIIAPYKNQLDSQMNVVIGTSLVTLTSKKPEGSLGDFFADVMKEQAEIIFNKKIDVAFFNSGGLRLPEIPKGNIKVTTIYELMPFENEIVVMEIDGKTLKKVLEYSAKRGGDPISGARYIINNNLPVDILINNAPLDPDKKYIYATNDYLANGGDNMTFMKEIPQQNLHVKLRDMLFEYFKIHTEAINLTTDGRIQVQK